MASFSYWSLLNFPNSDCKYDTKVVQRNGDGCSNLPTPAVSLSIICTRNEDVQLTVASSSDCSPVGAITWTGKAGTCISRTISGVIQSFIARCSIDYASAVALTNADLSRIQYGGTFGSTGEIGGTTRADAAASESGLTQSTIIAIAARGGGCVLLLILIWIGCKCFKSSDSSHDTAAAIHPQRYSDGSQHHPAIKINISPKRHAHVVF
jgi:hypothetical protein